jgi:transcriptional regulator with XRE-family HTH domain
MNKDIETAVGNNIRLLRERAGFTQEMLADKLQLRGCDITRSAVAKIEVGQRHLYPDEVILISEILDVSYDEIFTLHGIGDIGDR